MKRSAFPLSVVTILLLVAYIVYNEGKKPRINNNYPMQEQDPVGLMPVPGPEWKPSASTLSLPEKMDFAGEPVPLNIPHVRERLDRELHVNTYWHSNTIFLLKRGNRWLPQIEKILRQHGIPDDFKYLAAIESSLINAVSPAGATGFWQILKSSAKENGLEVTKEVDERYHPLKATTAACRYLKKAYAKFGNWTNAAASYNRGMTGLQNSLDEQQVSSYYDLLLNRETSRYIFRALAVKEIFEHPEKYGFEIDSAHLYQEEPLKYITVSQSKKDLVSFAKAQGITYKSLKRHNPWLRKNKLTVDRGKTYKIAIPTARP